MRCFIFCALSSVQIWVGMFCQKMLCALSSSGASLFIIDTVSDMRHTGFELPLGRINRSGSVSIKSSVFALYFPPTCCISFRLCKYLSQVALLTRIRPRSKTRWFQTQTKAVIGIYQAYRRRPIRTWTLIHLKVTSRRMERDDRLTRGVHFGHFSAEILLTSDCWW